MRRFISVLITTLLISAPLLPVAAQSQTTVLTTNSKNSVANQPSPFDLAYLAYQGYLEDQGIPSSSALLNAISSKTITATDVMQAAVKANRLSEQMLSDQGYRYSLDEQLQGLRTTD
jgi:hypothetical protein